LKRGIDSTASVSKRNLSLACGALGFLVALFLFKRPGWIHFLTAGAGFFLPWLYAREKEKKKRWLCFRVFPDFLELFAMALSAGLPFERAWGMAADHLPDGALKNHLQLVGVEFSSGRPRDESLRRLAERLNEPRLTSIFPLLIHAMKRGTPLQTILADQAESLRTMALSAIEKRAQTASVRLLVPVVLFLFPTLFLVVLGPLVLQYAQRGQFF